MLWGVTKFLDESGGDVYHIEGTCIVFEVVDNG